MRLCISVAGHILQVNPAREKKLSNVRTTAADEKVFLAPPKAMTLEDAIGEATIGRACNFPFARVLLQAGLLIWSGRTRKSCWALL